MKKPMEFIQRINESARDYASAFFISASSLGASDEELDALVDAINEDFDNYVFRVFRKDDNDTGVYSVVSGFNTMDSEQLNSKTHQTFLNIVKNHFGKDGYKILKERVNYNIFNCICVGAMSDKVIKTFGKEFAINMTNYNMTPYGQNFIYNALDNPEKALDYKFIYDHYPKSVINNPARFSEMIAGMAIYGDLIHDLRMRGKKLSKEEFAKLTEIFKDRNNTYSVNDAVAFDNYYDLKTEMYNAKLSICIDSEGYVDDFEQLVDAVLTNYFGLTFKGHETINGPATNSSKFYASANDVRHYFKHFDIKEIMEDESLKSKFTKEELEVIGLIDSIAKTVERYEPSDLLGIMKTLEARGNKMSEVTQSALTKLGEVFADRMIDTTLKVDTMETMVREGNPEISKDFMECKIDGQVYQAPVYKLAGPEYAFLTSTTMDSGGLSGNSLKGDIATGWFEYENGTSHISCSYSNQNKLSLYEHGEGSWNGIFEDPRIVTMGSTDIWTPSTPRISDIYSASSTKFTTPEKILKDTGCYNEIGILRRDHSVDYGGGCIMPQALLCIDEVDKTTLRVAASFTKYAVEHGIKPPGWVMPIVVIDREAYKRKKEELARKLVEEDKVPSMDDFEEMEKPDFEEQVTKEATTKLLNDDNKKKSSGR